MNKTTAERGKFKKEINIALYKNDDLRELILGDTTGKSAAEIQKDFKNHVKSHLFIDDTITESGSFIFYDVVMPRIGANIKECVVVLYAMCHRDILDDYYKEGYFGDRADCLSQMIEDSLLNNPDVVNKFGIGELMLDSVDIYNATRFYGTIMTFRVSTFR